MFVSFRLVALARDCASDGNRPKDGGRVGQAEKAKDRLSFCADQQKATICAHFLLGQNRRTDGGDFASLARVRPALGCFLHWH
jgi:hypothetical protein